MDLPIVTEIEDDTYLHSAVCPDFAGVMVLSEAGPELDAHACVDCGSLFNDCSGGVVV